MKRIKVSSGMSVTLIALTYRRINVLPTPMSWLIAKHLEMNLTTLPKAVDLACSCAVR